MRYFLELEYFGKAYFGWQRQPKAISVQQVIEETLSTLLQEPVSIVGAGRTDTGVHAKQSYAHFDTARALDPNFMFRINALLPRDVSILSLKSVKEDAHARFDAVARSYEYHIATRKNAFEIDRSYFVKRALNVEKMNRAAAVLLTYGDFKCFSRSRTDVHTYHCNIGRAEWIKVSEDKLIFHITADRFLRNMVRAIVGTLLEIGLEKRDVASMHDIIKSQNRTEAGASVPACGLYLTEVVYPKRIFN